MGLSCTSIIELTNISSIAGVWVFGCGWKIGMFGFFFDRLKARRKWSIARYFIFDRAISGRSLCVSLSAVIAFHEENNFNKADWVIY